MLSIYLYQTTNKLFLKCLTLWENSLKLKIKCFTETNEKPEHGDIAWNSPAYTSLTIMIEIIKSWLVQRWEYHIVINTIVQKLEHLFFIIHKILLHYFLILDFQMSIFEYDFSNNIVNKGNLWQFAHLH